MVICVIWACQQVGTTIPSLLGRMGFRNLSPKTSSAEKDRLLAVFSSKGERVGKVWVGTRLAQRVAHACGLNDYREDAPFSVFAFRLNRDGVLI